MALDLQRRRETGASLACAAALTATLAAVADADQSVGRPSGPTRIGIAAGTVSDAQSRAGLVGTWEPDADLGAPPGANQVTYFEDGLYFSPLRNIALVGLWEATARSLTLTPLDVRNLETTDKVPEMKAALAQITWDKAGASTLTWLDPDRHRESGSQFGRRRVAASRDLGVLHLATLTALLTGAWGNDAGTIRSFQPGGLYVERTTTPDGRDVLARGFYRFEPTTGVLHATIERVEGEGGQPVPSAQTAARAPAAVRLITVDEVEIAGVRWRRERPYVRGSGGWMR